MAVYISPSQCSWSKAEGRFWRDSGACWEPSPSFLPFWKTHQQAPLPSGHTPPRTSHAPAIPQCKSLPFIRISTSLHPNHPSESDLITPEILTSQRSQNCPQPPQSTPAPPQTPPDATDVSPTRSASDSPVDDRSQSDCRPTSRKENAPQCSTRPSQ